MCVLLGSCGQGHQGPSGLAMTLLHMVELEQQMDSALCSTTQAGRGSRFGAADIAWAEGVMLAACAQVAEARSDETFVALCLLTVTGASLLTQKLGFSDTMGAFVAGVLLAETNYSTQVRLCTQAPHAPRM